MVEQLFAGKEPLSNVPCAQVAGSPPILPYAGMSIIITENRDKASRIVNSQDATLVSVQGTTLILHFSDDQQAFLYPVTHYMEGEGDVTRYPMTPAYARTISKSQGQNLRHLLVWLDCPLVPAGLRYVALSRVRRKADLSIMQPMLASQLTPVQAKSLLSRLLNRLSWGFCHEHPATKPLPPTSAVIPFALGRRGWGQVLHLHRFS